MVFFSSLTTSAQLHSVQSQTLASSHVQREFLTVYGVRIKFFQRMVEIFYEHRLMRVVKF